MFLVPPKARFSATARRKAGGGGGGDPYFSNVSLLLHMDGSNGSTTFTDSSANNFAVTNTGVVVSTTQSKFGGAAGYFENSTYLSTAYASQLDFISGDFTVESFIYPTAQRWVMSAGGTSFGWNSTTGLHWLIGLGSNKLEFQYWNGASNSSLVTSNLVTPLNTWRHIAVCRSGNTIHLAIDGTVTSHAGLSIVRPSANPTLAIGIAVNGTGFPSYTYNGYMDELRITKGVARYTSNFTPPIAPFPNS